MAIRALSTAATGMIAQQQHVDVIANNIANASTVGFKRTRANFEDLFYQRLQQGGVSANATSRTPTGIEIGLGTKLVSTQKIHSQGAVEITENDLDVAIVGDGFFRVDIGNGATGYTRAGNFQLDLEGNIVTPEGFKLLDVGQKTADMVSISISRGGIVEGILQDGTSQQLGQLQLAKFVNPAGLNSEGDNIYVESIASGAPILGNPSDTAQGIGALQQGSLESSNIQAVIELVGLIKAQRSFEINSNIIRASDQMLQVTNNLRA